jgi:hypothetical protein
MSNLSRVRAMPLQPYSYRSDLSVPEFDDSRPLIVFDGLAFSRPRAPCRLPGAGSAVRDAAFRMLSVTVSTTGCSAIASAGSGAGIHASPSRLSTGIGFWQSVPANG